MSIKTNLVAASLFVALVGCSKEKTHGELAQEEAAHPDQIIATQIFNGTVLSRVKEGGAEVIIPANRWSGDYDLNCIALHSYKEFAITCDFLQ